jgi:hypothetical protein
MKKKINNPNILFKKYYIILELRTDTVFIMVDGHKNNFFLSHKWHCNSPILG